MKHIVAILITGSIQTWSTVLEKKCKWWQRSWSKQD